MESLKVGKSSTNVVQHSAFPRLEAMWRAGKGCDVTIMCKNNKEIIAHSLVLCSVSDKLDELLLLNADKMINSFEVEAETWEALLEVIYTGHYGLNDETEVKIENMLSVARSLGMSNIVNQCEKIIQDRAKKETVIVLAAGETSRNENIEFFQEVETDVKISVQPEDRVVRKKKCFHCKDKCRAKRVKCYHCFRIVDNDISHMQNYHPFTPASSIFAYSCRFIANDSASKEWTVFTKIVSIQNDANGAQVKGFLFQCHRCEVKKPNLEEIMRHSNVDHGIVAKVCKVCYTGFLKNVFVKDHENFCKGGDLLKCDDCGKVVGGYHALWSHMAQHRHGGSSEATRKANPTLKESTASYDNDLKQALSESPGLEELEEAKVSVKTDRKKMCINCKEVCKNQWVKCVYCERIVLNTTRHMDQHHHFTPKDSMWVYFCKYNVSKGNSSKMSHVCSKEAIHGEASTLKYVCQKCKVSYKTLNMIDKHLKVKHEIYTVHHCPACDMGFSSSSQYDDHTYFCEGGDIASFTTSKKDLTVEADFVSAVMKSSEKQDGAQTRFVGTRALRRSIKKPVRFRETVSVFEEVDGEETNKTEDLGDRHDTEKYIVAGSLDDVYLGQSKQCIDADDSKKTIEVAITGKTLGLTRNKESRYEEIKGKSHNGGDNGTDSEELCDSTETSTSNLTNLQKKSYCTLCGKNCDAQLVHCLYCLKTVERKSTHMKREHPFTPVSSYWIFSCKGESSSLQSQEDNENVLLFVKELASCSEHTNCHYMCKVCNQMAGDLLDEAIAHVRTRHNIEPFVCNVCETGFSSASVQSEHEYFCSGGEPCKCSICGLFCLGIDKLASHKAKVHRNVVEVENSVSSGENITNDIVNEAAANSSEKQDRVICAVTTEPYELQDEQRKEGLELIEKVKSEEETDLSSGVCSHCYRSCEAVTVRCLYCFKVVDNDITHKELGHPHSPAESIWVYTCQLEEGEGEWHNQSMIFIKESVHKKPSSFRKMHKQGKTEKFKCLQCDNNFTSMDILLKHVVHQFRCLKCKLIFTTKDSVKRHVELMHNQTSYRCESCECGFLDEGCCEDHSYLCSGGGRMSCTVCTRMFWRVTDFKEHSQQCQPTKRIKLQQESFRSEKIEEPSVTMGTSEPDDDNDIEDPLYTTEEPVRKAGRGRPRKRGVIRQNTATGKMLRDRRSQTDEALKTSLRAHFEEVQIERVKAHQKMCLVCEGNCLSTAVKCGYCGGQVKEADMDNHMVVNHPMIPATSLWFVTCRCYRVSNQVDHLTRQIIEQQQVTDENNIIEEGVYMSLLAGYECVICDEKFSGDDILKHLEGEHKIDSFMCETCGVVIKSDGKISVHDHKHMCAGGDIVKCKECDKRFASWQSANKHRKITHMETKRKRRTARSLVPTKILDTQGDYGYLIRCVDCDGTCHTGHVKCSLCLEIVPKNDIHMKLKHAYSPSTTWVVTCRYSIPTADTQVKGFAGGRVAVSETELLGHPTIIPCTLDFHYKCFWCDALFSNRKQFKDHIRLTHFKTMEHKTTGLVMYYCKHCDAVLIGRSYFFSDHVQFCSKGEVYQCEECDIQFCYLQKMHLHWKKRHPEVIQRRKALKSAAIQSNGKVPIDIPAGTVLQCAECSYTTEKLTLLKRHNRLEHKYRGGQLHQLCRFCFKVFRVRSDRERHEQSEHLEGQDVVCHICGQSYEIPNQLERHMYYYHKGGREYLSIKQKDERKKNVMKVCGYCGKEYTIAAKLNRHVRVVHEKSLEFKCSVCMKEYGSRDSLRIHENKHRGNKPFSCPYCTYKDYRGYIVNSHVEREHPGREKPYKRTSVFHSVSDVLEDGNFEQQPLVVEYVKSSGPEYSQTSEVIQLSEYTIEESDQQHQFVEVVQKYEVQQECSEIEISQQQIDVKEIAVDNLEEVTTAGEVLMEYYVT